MALPIMPGTSLGESNVQSEPGSWGRNNTVAAQIPTADEIRIIVHEAVAPLRLELERLHSQRETLVSLPEAARRLGVTLRAVQRWAKDGRLDIVPVGGLRMVRLPDGTPEK
jgi:excisionase family DNA binding protein